MPTPHTAAAPCPVCQGHQKLPHGQGIRCFGFSTDDGWALCTRIESPWYKEQANGWSHKMDSHCRCGATHGNPSEDEKDWRGEQPPARQAPPTSNPKPKAEVREIGDTPKAKLVETYDYTSRKGKLLYQVCRMHPKTFRQRRKHPTQENQWVWKLKADEKSGLPEQPTVLYRLPELAEAFPAGDTVFIAEGEKDVEAFRRRQLVATCNTGGSGKWRDDLARAFQHCLGSVVIVQDIDPETNEDGSPHRRGQLHARAVYDSIVKFVPEGTSVSIVEARSGKDAHDHFAAGHGVHEFVLVWPMTDDMLSTHPGEYKRHVLRQALLMHENALVLAQPTGVPEQPPQFTSALRRGSYAPDIMQGCVTVAGAPSSGKSYFAISTGVDNALNREHPWEVFYLNCEMAPDYVTDRTLRAAASAHLYARECQSAQERKHAVDSIPHVEIPKNFHRVDVGLGATMEELIEMLANNVTDLPTLVIMDSISSFVDNMTEVEGDNFGMSNLRTVQKFATAVRRLTKGHVAWILLSELNKEGRAKGRSLDHRSDMAISMSPDPDQGSIKKINVTKSWFGPTGPLGDFVLWPDIARLVTAELV